VVVDPLLFASDVDDVNLESAVVTITNPLDARGGTNAPAGVITEVLAATTTGTSIVAVYNAPVLTLTGSDSLANYRQVLRSVTYANPAQNPSMTARVISFQANDGTVGSNTVTTTVMVAPA